MMKTVIYNLACYLVLRLSPDRDYKVSDKDAEDMDKWLKESFQRDGFKAYCLKRDYTLLKLLGGGIDREKYLLNVGRRMEILNLLGEVKAAWDKDQKK